ncbi:DUF192 domain-containing protein [Stenotrophomonas sp. W1S232]|jgi:uncharacterized membrane protein (UPF0127 family)|uniref:DUF192 domain-containing protein n=1 Tax=Stenotrophomonas koreensis TaxID=266128 RepID=A0A7W3V0R4_9GAMM|nr:DUF192 domain-containing protein [Stenotrophomonas koreensis]MBB1117355.1 DUF192 domain-containing protein [Stenotrophomonas koreensis]
MQRLALYRQGHCLLADVGHARYWHQRARGLLARPRLQPGQGLLIEPCASVHTCFMGYALDLVFLDRGNRVLGWREHLPPWRAAGLRGAHATLELPAGSLHTLVLEIGQQLHWQPALSPHSPGMECT